VSKGRGVEWRERGVGCGEASDSVKTFSSACGRLIKGTAPQKCNYISIPELTKGIRTMQPEEEVICHTRCAQGAAVNF